MRLAGTPMDKKTVAKLVRLDISTDISPWQMSKEEALVLIGEAMFERFVEEFRDVWHDLFSDRQTSEIRVSTEQIQAYVREEWKPSSEYQGAAHLRNEYLQDRVSDPSCWYLRRGGDKYGMAGTYRLK